MWTLRMEYLSTVSLKIVSKQLRQWPTTGNKITAVWPPILQPCADFRLFIVVAITCWNFFRARRGRKWISHWNFDATCRRISAFCGYFRLFPVDDCYRDHFPILFSSFPWLLPQIGMWNFDAVSYSISDINISRSLVISGCRWLMKWPGNTFFYLYMVETQKVYLWNSTISVALSDIYKYFRFVRP